MKTLKNIIQANFTKLKGETLSKLKRAWAKEIGFIPKNSQVLKIYNQLLKEKKIKPSIHFKSLLITRKTRTQSGVAPMAVMTKPFACPGQCIYCPQEKDMPKSYLSDEPAAQRAKKVKFNPKLQIKSRLKQLKATGHTTDKIEIIVIGGTFSVYPKNYKLKFFKAIFDTLNNQTSKNLQQAQEINETAKHRVVGISVETRPDWISATEIKLLRKLGVTKIQLGVQAFDEKILKKINRGHSLKPVAQATKLLKNAGFKICYHFMPNLPSSTPKKDLSMAKIMFQDPRFKPDYLKVYPVQVIPGTKLHTLFKAGKFKTYPDDVLKQVLKNIKKITPPWIRIDRLVRDISKQWISSGTLKTNIRQIILLELARENKTCQCIRCREIKDLPLVIPAQAGIYAIKKIIINTLGGQEYFLSFEDKGKLYSLLRLRLPNKNQTVIFKELKNAAIIREVHTFGSAMALKEHQSTKTQHQGLGKKLVKKAEKISQKNGFKKLAVISAIGTKEYYKKLGFYPEGLYMTKDI
ncbi:tRNA uridine(34) 5-carboxymethylaminomethyl modification radical SAM/GNAT enzyme Elp3 [Patescibacteria group bacterium]|nr:tRNA uridine(34) 5-carboxymethylaminomethyl modification radical SAM/GNAT enzyme Elp3 [Patescibacteria group bacterium]MBU1256099.1 tRNA uridine(34) 5-carboxymethylaminomethyl modification radical SAM/GNAT enzyme Elp3 [Patescibacteria group bacterium]MBU1457228.1 tRNA uridine(34) 5-carboxymethylaminomethyl modification radical SAM/GNAT enzyme Elp3 [Patescibacteria group bacterium]